MNRLTRRQALPLLLGPALIGRASAQEARGMASRGVKALPRGKASGLPFHSSFVNVSEAAGLHAPVIYGSVGHTDYILEAMGCGVAFIDYDNDGWIDIIVLTGRRYQGTPKEAIIRLYKNNRDGTFTDVTEKSGLGRSVWACGLTVGDYDNDGYDDVFITCWGQNILFHNNGDGTFSDVTEKAGLLHKGTRYGTGCTWIDYDRDGRLDLFVSHYLVFDPAKVAPAGKNPACNWKGVPVNCGPVGFQQEACRLYHNNGDGTFTDVSEKAGISTVKPGFALTAVTADFDGDGWPDIYVACDTSASLLFRNNHDGTFTEVGLERGVALNEDGQEQAGMGVGIGDFNTDGAIDIFKTHFTEDTPVLYENDGHGNFRDVTIRAGLGVETRYVSWGAAIADFDNDGLPDLFFATGMVYPEPEVKLHAYPYKTPCVLFRNLGNGHFEELLEQGGAAIHVPHSSRGVAFGDFDNDGDVDILIVNLNEPPSLLRNDVSGGNHWLKVFLQGVESNRSAIGAQVIVTYGDRKQAQAVTAQSSYVSASDRRLHFGLGKATSAAVDVRWPNGKQEKIGQVDVDQLVVIREGSGIVKKERFSRR
ncbi:MAG TPA: CRTAC1 family protein [Bryobacteraceae bacterium]|nr:CRTAC1 family protein [Bryobacteraceae bacterium]